MATVEKLCIALTPEFAADIREAIAAGDHASTSEVIRDALRAWKQARQGRATRTPRAGADLDEIRLHVARDSPAAADRLVDRIVDRCRELTEHSRLGQARPEIASEARMLVIDDYLALYRVEGRGAEIVRMVHGARRLDGLFD